MVSNIEYEVDERVVEYSAPGRQGVGWLAFISHNGTNHQDLLSTQKRRARWAMVLNRQSSTIVEPTYAAARVSLGRSRRVWIVVGGSAVQCSPMRRFIVVR